MRRWGHFGYGWYAMSNDTFDYVEHGGVTQSGGFICFTARIPQQDITVAIFTNRAWSRANQASQHIGTRAKALLSIATDGAFPMPPLEDIGP